MATCGVYIAGRGAPHPGPAQGGPGPGPVGMQSGPAGQQYGGPMQGPPMGQVCTCVQHHRLPSPNSLAIALCLYDYLALSHYASLVESYVESWVIRT